MNERYCDPNLEGHFEINNSISLEDEVELRRFHTNLTEVSHD
jgi:hypothetical protein